MNKKLLSKRSVIATNVTTTVLRLTWRNRLFGIRDPSLLHDGDGADDDDDDNAVTAGAAINFPDIVYKQRSSSSIAALEVEFQAWKRTSMVE